MRGGRGEIGEIEGEKVERERDNRYLRWYEMNREREREIEREKEREIDREKVREKER